MRCHFIIVSFGQLMQLICLPFTKYLLEARIDLSRCFLHFDHMSTLTTFKMSPSIWSCTHTQSSKLFNRQQVFLQVLHILQPLNCVNEIINHFLLAPTLAISKTYHFPLTQILPRHICKYKTSNNMDCVSSTALQKPTSIE